MSSSMAFLSLVLVFLASLSFSCFPSVAIDVLAQNQALRDNGETIVSAGGKFVLGFFRQPSSNARYVGIWFGNVRQPTVFWVANRDNPVPDSSGILAVTSTGNIVIGSNQTREIWSSNSSSTRAIDPIMRLLDNGNLVLMNRGDEISSGNYLWQSFDYPGDTLIPGMKLGWNLRTNQEWYLRSWRSLQDPGSGDYTLRFDRSGLPQIILRQGSQIKYRGGPWDGVRFGVDFPARENKLFKPIIVVDSDNMYYTFENVDNTTVSRYVVNQTGQIQHLWWSERTNEWTNFFTSQDDRCDTYGSCGANGVCNIDKPLMCACPDGFVPRSPAEWGRDWSDGCVLRTPLNCSATYRFRRFSTMKLPDASHLSGNRSEFDLGACEQTCQRNCSCVAYAMNAIVGCALWFGDMVDMKESNGRGSELFVRMAASEFDSTNNSRRTAIIASVSVISGFTILGLIVWIVSRKTTRAARQYNESENNSQIIKKEELELPLFDYLTVSIATNGFSIINKLGKGGFGPVYKGMLFGGQEIAVKRLTKDSRQGMREFKNEVTLISKLQHRNLVKLLGCCIHGDERMLIYEYMPNRSLDFLIFNQTSNKLLDWRKRFDIIVGITRGILYLHRDSRLRIIHRDLKASNILLDNDMNPMISDFGLARTFRNDQSKENTRRVMGTYGYMSPEYAIDGFFSMKSDVFSFGVLVLEILSGKRNRGFSHPDHDLNLLGHAWKLWNDDNALTLLDASIRSSVSESEVLRCIQIGLLCVQQRPEDRPTISAVLLMLDSENLSLTQPKQPGFYTERFLFDAESSLIEKKSMASNEITITSEHGR